MIFVVTCLVAAAHLCESQGVLAVGSAIKSSETASNGVARVSLQFCDNACTYSGSENASAFMKDLLGESSEARVQVVIENQSEFDFEFGLPYTYSGYYNLEFDIRLRSGETMVVKKKRVGYIRDLPYGVVVLPQRRWRKIYRISKCDWEWPGVVSITNAVAIRPRFAFGCYKIDGVYSRKLPAGNEDLQNVADTGGRQGELEGDWIPIGETD